jgi:hypothetical protein
MDPLTLIIIVLVIVFLVGGPTWYGPRYGGSGWYGNYYGGGGVFLVVVILLVLFLTGHIHLR